MDIKNSITELWQTFSNRAKRIDIIQDLKPFCLKLGDTPDVANNTGIQKITLIPKNITADYVVKSLDSAFVLSDDLNSGNWYSMLKLNADITRDVYIKTIKSNVLGNYNADIAIFSSELEERRLSLEGHTGDGTATYPFPIASAKQLYDVRNNMASGVYYKQYADIDLAGYSNFPALSDNTNRFNAIYDGNNYKIINFKQNQQGADSFAYGLFGYSSGTIKNVILYGIIDIPSSVYVQTVGLLTGASISTDNCHVFGSIKCKGTYIGGLVGFTHNITNCSANVEIEALTGSQYVGLLIGRKWHTIMSNCRATGKITGSAQYVGGMLGQNVDNSTNKEIENSYCNAYINMTTATNIGGFIGKDEFIKTDKTSEYTNCYCNTIIEGAGTKKGFIGAIVDGCTSEAKGCVWNAELSGIADDALLPAESGLEDKYMRLRQTFIDLGWSESIWLLEDGNYPKLRCEIL
jgi:hypothetical protein